MAKNEKVQPGRIEADPVNVQIWEELRTPDPAFTKKFDRGGFKGRMTSPIYIGRRMTEVFGPIGLGWGWTIEDITYIPADRPEVVYTKVRVWYKNPYPAAQNNRDDVVEIGEITHIGGGQLMKFRKEKGSDKAVPVGYDDEAVKGAVTDAISKALSYLGMSADIHMGLFDDVKYLKEAESIFDRTDPIDPSAAGAQRQNDLADARAEQEETRSPPPKKAAAPKKEPEPEPEPEPERDEKREREDWLDDTLDRIEKVNANQEGYELLFSIRDHYIKPKVDAWGKDDECVDRAVKAFRKRRRELEDALGLD